MKTKKIQVKNNIVKSVQTECKDWIASMHTQIWTN